MRLTKEQVMNFPPEAYESNYTIRVAISQRYSCGIDEETSARIIRDYRRAQRDLLLKMN